MIDVKSKSKINIHWKVSPYDFSKEKLNSLIAKASKKYEIPKDRIKVIPEFIISNDGSGDIALATDIIQNIQDPQFQLKLFQDYLNVNKIADYDFELIKMRQAQRKINLLEKIKENRKSKNQLEEKSPKKKANQLKKEKKV